MAEQPIRLGLLVDEKWYTEFFVKLGTLLRDTGEVAPTLFMCRESAPDPECDIPFVRFKEETGQAPQHTYDWHAITGYERFLANKDNYFEGRWDNVAQSLTAQAEAFFSENPFDCIVLWSGTRMNLRAVAAAARKCGVAVVTIETPYFQKLPEPPETDFVMDLHRMKNRVLIWDTVQAPQTGPSQLSRDWKTASIRPGLQEFFDKLHAERVSKYSQEDIKRFLSGKADATVDGADMPDVEVELFKPPRTRALLVLGQVSHDSARYFGDHLIDDWREMGLELAKRLPPDWIMWFKGHPMDRAYAEGTAAYARELHDINPRCKVLPTTMDIHLCYQRCDAVACVNSTSTIEAATYNIPVINFGWAAFTEVGMSYKLGGLSEVAPLLESLPPQMTPEQVAIRDHFLSYVLYDYLIPVGSPRKALARIRQAIAENASHSSAACRKAPQAQPLTTGTTRPGAPEPNAEPKATRLMLLSLPKAGTYLAAELVRLLGMRHTHYHFSMDYVDAYDPAQLDAGKRAPESVRMSLPIEQSLRLLRLGEFGVGHLPCEERTIHALAGFRLMLCLRPPRDNLLSMMRFLYDTRRDRAAAGSWFEKRDVAAFVRERGPSMLRQIKTILPWANFADVHCLTFAEMTTAGPQTVTKLAKFLRAPEHIDAEAIAARALSENTLTRSRSDEELKWTEEAEDVFKAIGGEETDALVRSACNPTAQQ